MTQVIQLDMKITNSNSEIHRPMNKIRSAYYLALMKIKSFVLYGYSVL